MKKSLSDSSLKKILDTTNERDLFLVGHMYIENTIDRIMLSYYPELGIDMRINYSQTSKGLEITLESYTILGLRLNS